MKVGFDPQSLCKVFTLVPVLTAVCFLPAPLYLKFGETVVTMEEGERVRVVTIRTLKNAQGKQGMKLYAELLDPIGGVILGFQRRAEIVIKQSESFDGLSISRAQQIVGKSLIWVSLIVGFGLTVFAVVYTVNTNRRKTADELAFLVVHQSPPAQSEEPVAPTV